MLFPFRFQAIAITHRPRAILGIIFLLFFVETQHTLWGQNNDVNGAPALGDQERVGPIKLNDVPLDQVLELLERWTNKSILRPQNLPATTLTLNLKGEVSKAQAIRAIETLLSLNSIGVSSLDDKFLKITPLAAAKSEAPVLISGSTLDLPPSGAIASKLFHPKFLRVGDFIPQVAGLLNPAAGAPPALFEKANTALITDSLSNLQRVESLLNQMDRPDVSHLQPKFYTLQFARATDLVNKLHGILTGPLQSDLGSATFNAEERTNQIVLFADPQQYAIFDRLIARFDVKSGEDTRTDIIYLMHADAKEVASILTQLVTSQIQVGRTSTSGGDAVHAVATSPTSINQTPTEAALISPLELKHSSPSQFSTLVGILPEQRSNALLVSGTENDIRLLNSLVAKIDVLLAEVRIEVVIAEVTLDDSHTSGIGALGLQIKGDKLVGFSGSAPGLAVTNGTVTYPNPGATPPVVVSGPWDLAAQISLATTPRKSITNLLSVPNIVTTHNHAGKIIVGQSQPIITATQATPLSAGTTTSFSTSSQVTYKDIGIELTVKPLIGTDGSVQMDIKQEVDDILGETTIDGNPQPTIGRRSTDSFVSAKSGEIIVLGGLQRRTGNKSTSRLGPIPILGDLIGSRSNGKTRTDLIFFLRPTILTNAAQDNVSAIRQIERFSKTEKQELKDVLGAPAPSQKH